MKKFSILMLSMAFFAFGVSAQTTTAKEKSTKFEQCDKCKKAGKDAKACEKKCGNGKKGSCAEASKAKCDKEAKKCDKAQKCCGKKGDAKSCNKATKCCGKKAAAEKKSCCDKKAAQKK